MMAFRTSPISSVRALTLPFLVVALVALGGCAETMLVAETAKYAGDGSHRESGYKVGKPYEINGVRYTPEVDDSYDEVGVASWYGRKFHGRKTANGERYDMNALTAAHTTLPLPTMVRVTNLENGRSVKLRVNDRGPFVDDRIIDVSRKASQLLGFKQAGTAKVRVEVIDDDEFEFATVASEAPPSVPPVRTAPPVTIAAAPPAKAAASPRPTTPWSGDDVYVQAGAFAYYQNAIQVSNRLRQIGPVMVAPIRLDVGEMYRVRLGPVSTIDEAERLRVAVVDAGFPASRVVIE